MVWLVTVPAVASASVAGAMRERRIDRQRVALRRVAPAVSVTLTVKLAVPGAVGVPVAPPSPPPRRCVRFAAVSPVVPALKPEMLKVV